MGRLLYMVTNMYENKNVFILIGTKCNNNLCSKIEMRKNNDKLQMDYVNDK